mmetsp:Transcript_26107/g.54479  ORF Transcript_26107/g.54479 Transcript_26107/m.54479 type:complete len:1090 (-) Transcript_26107:173-3442(-)
MGIQGLLRNLHPLLVPPPNHPSNNQQNNDNNSSTNNNNNNNNNAQRRNNPAIRHNIRQFSQKSLAIDASSWLHKAAYTCAERLVESTESNTRDPIAERSYCKYMIDRCDELLDWAGVRRIYLVFDGVRVSLKSGTNAEREARRRANLREARRLVACGRRNEASEKYRSCVKGNEEMARVVAGVVEAKYGRDESGTDGNVRVKCVWSPYEADAQLAKLCVDGWAHAVVTEDSDVLVYSAVTRKPFPIIYKLDRKNGACDVVTMDWLVNPTFLAALNANGGPESSRSSRRRRRREIGRDSDHRNNSSRSVEDEKRDGEEADGDDNEAEKERHCCEVEYDDLGLAPIRRALPLPTSSSGGGGKSGGRGKRRGSGGSSDGNAGGNALLSCLRAFANKEVSSPGAGVRLFVQACVLSGCDYVPNRLSKVGPVTAFKLVKEASHRDPAVRFERVLKSLPAGSKLIAEVSANRSDDGGEDDDGEEDEEDFLSPPDSDRDAKQKYEELLSKSQAVFYYHLAKEISSGEIVPLVAHNSSSKSRNDGDGNRSLEADEGLRPCVDRFEEGLSFVGSVAEALKNKTTPLPTVTKSQGGHSRRPAMQPQRANNNGGWMSSNRRSLTSSGAVHNNWYQKKPVSATVAMPPPKETFLLRFLNGLPKKTKATTSVLSNNNSMNIGSVKAIGSANAVCQGKRSSHFAGSSSVSFEKKKKNPLHKPSAFLTTSNANALSTMTPNPFAAYARSDASSLSEEETEISKQKPSPTTTLNHAPHKALEISPMFLPVNFDYGGYTPPPHRNGSSESKTSPSKPKHCTDDAKRMSSNAAAAGNALSSIPTIELIDVDDDDDENEKHCDDNSVMDGNESENLMNEPTATGSEDHEDCATGNDDAFDYGVIVEESPPRKVSQRGFLSKYIRQTTRSDNDHIGPRRVSTSPTERMKINNEVMQRGCSLEDIIDLSDDHDEPCEEDILLAASSSTSRVRENPQNSNQSSIKSAPKIWKSSVNKQQFKSPYPTNHKAQKTTTKTKNFSSSSQKNTNNKALRTSSSALLAGFARQESSSAGSKSGTKRKSRFFASTLVGKRPKGTPSLKSFMVPSHKDR